MNPDWLLKHFEQISEAPDAVPRLRRFILDLAVRGKLVEQDPEDEPITALFEKIDQERTLTAKKDRRAEADLQELLADQLCWEVPPTWRWRALADLVLFIDYRGKTPSKVNSGIRLITAKNVRWGFINLQPEEFVTEATYGVWMTRGLPHEGDILFTTEAPMGNAAVVRLQERFGLAQRVINLRPYGDLNSDFLVLEFLSSPFQIILNETSTGLTAKGIKAAKLKRLPVAVPPLAEQHRIVAKVDELMALCDKLEAAQAKRERRRDLLVAATLYGLNNGDDSSELEGHPFFDESARFYFNHLPRLTTRPEHIHQLRQTILNLAVRGKLVPQDSKDEPAAELLKHIQAEKGRLIKEGKIRVEKLLPTVSNHDVPFDIPANWVWTRIGSCSLFTDYGTSVKSAHSDDGVPVLKMGDIHEGGVLLGGQQRVPRSIDDLPQLFLNKFDLLYNRTNSAELVGKTGIFMDEDDTYTFASYLIRIRFIKHLVSPVYANLAMNAPYFRETQIIPELKQQCGQANVNGTKLKSMIIPLPPQAEQYRIVAKVDELMALCDGLETRLTTLAATRHQLLEATLVEALSGHCELQQEQSHAN